MKKYAFVFSLALALMATAQIFAQTSSDLDLSTRSVGVPPSHVTVNSVAQWMENPLDQKVQVTVTNFYAGTNDCMDMAIGGKHLKFYGAGLDNLGNYIPTNYPPVTVGMTLRREYNLNITCPNSGPDGSPLYKFEDFQYYPDTFVGYI
ncbi:MAG TPA: hypothetical protein VGO57_10115, partial [Verrucomicrobiae bacterium]